jgi:hypothetical protein
VTQIFAPAGPLGWPAKIVILLASASAATAMIHFETPFNYGSKAPPEMRAVIESFYPLRGVVQLTAVTVVADLGPL